MLKVLLILFIVIYLMIVLVNTFVRPFMEGYKKDGSDSSESSGGKLIVTHNPEKGKRNRKGNSDDYIDFEEVKGDD